MTTAITVRGANKHYGDFAALDNIDFDVPANEIVEGERLARKAKTQRAIVVLVNVAAGLALLRVARVNLVAFTLEIRAIISADFRAFVPVQAEPLQPIENGAHRRFGGKRRTQLRDVRLAADVPRIDCGRSGLRHCEGEGMGQGAGVIY